jgi:hypothetical protein
MQNAPRKTGDSAVHMFSNLGFDENYEPHLPCVSGTGIKLAQRLPGWFAAGLGQRNAIFDVSNIDHNSWAELLRYLSFHGTLRDASCWFRSLQQERKMMKTFLATACAFALSTSFALAQPSQGQAGAATGPTSNSATSEKPSGMNNGAMNNGSGMQNGTTGTSSGGGSGMTTSGGANGNPNGMPKTTTGPTGSASKDESPPK